MKQLEKLMLTVGLLDKITGPMRGIQRTIRQVTDNSRKAFMNTAAGVTALIAASTSFASTVNPANDVNNALREVSSLEVADDTLSRLNQAGLQYSIQFGDSAANYVRSAYDIQSAISGLAGDDLPRFTTAAGTLAKATKANVGDITSYVGTMYGIFRKHADAMGKGEWVEQLAGKTAAAVQMFKTTGPEMASAFESLGAGAQTMGVSLQEQMAVLGTLQSTMSGSEAGTQYGAFLEGLAGAQSDLGLNFTDSSGQLLPIVDILQMIKGEMNGMGALEAQSFLSGAFDDQAVAFIQLMQQDLGKLNGDIANLAQQDGMEKAIWMAERMQDPWARLAAGIQSVSTAIWQKALPVIEPYINQITAAMSVLVEWADKYPHLTQAVGLAVTAFIGFVAIAGIMNIAIGMARFAVVGFTMRFLLVRPVVWGARLAVMAFTAVVWLLRTALLAFVLYGPAVSAFFTMLKASFLTAVPAIWAFTAALLANPLTWIVVGVVAVIAAIAALIYYWDEVTAAVGAGWSWLRNLFEENEWMKFVFAPIYLGMNAVDELIGVFQKIPDWWDGFSKWLANLNPFSVLGDGIDWVQSKLSWLPGIDAPDVSEQQMGGLSLPGSSSQSEGEKGGLFQAISNMFGGSSKSTSVEKIEVHNHGTGVRGDELAYEMEMAGM